MTVRQWAGSAACCVVLNACGFELDLGGHGQCNPSVTITQLAFHGTGTPGTPSVCNGIAPPVPTILNMPYMMLGSDVLSYGTDPYSWVTYTNHSSGQDPPKMTQQDGGLTIAGQITNPDGLPGHRILGGLGIASTTNCVDASAFAGIGFEVSGDFGGCQVQFEVNTSEDSDPTVSKLGRCDAAASLCESPSVTLMGTGTVDLPFAAFSAGSPQATVDSASVQSLQWVFSAL